MTDWPTGMLKVYLAGPDVFLPDSLAVGRRKKELCARYGFEGLYPFDNEVKPEAEGGERLDMLIYRANVAMIAEADLGILNLTPFRSPSADVGTVFELGLLVGLGKPVFGYTNETADLLERVRRRGPAAFDAASGCWRDEAGMVIEAFGNADNLMIDCALAEHGQPIVRQAASPQALYRELAGFEACLQLATEALGVVSAGPQAG